MKTVVNPKDGALIKDFWFENQLYFSYKDGKEFKPGETCQLEDKFADYLIKIYGFLEETAVSEAEDVKKANGGKKSYKCEFPGCGFMTGYAIAFSGHQRKHKVKEVVSVKQKEDTQDLIEAENAKSGLIGEGLVEESYQKMATA